MEFINEETVTRFSFNYENSIIQINSEAVHKTCLLVVLAIVSASQHSLSSLAQWTADARHPGPETLSQ